MRLKNPFSVNALIILSILIIGCNRKAEIPSYLEIVSIDLNQIENTSFNSINASDAWIYIDDELQGSYQLPCRIPILKQGEHKVSIKTGVLLFAQQSIREEHPHINSFDTIINFSPESSYVLTPKTSYKNSSNFIYNEGFEDDSEFSLDLLINDKDTSINYFHAQSDFGDNSAKFETENRSLAIVTKDSFSFQKDEEMYIEIDYITNSSVELGVLNWVDGSWEEVPILINIPKKASWNKIYLDPIPYLTDVSNSGYFKFYILADVSEGNGELLIDNLNIIK